MKIAPSPLMGEGGFASKLGISIHGRGPNKNFNVSLSVAKGLKSDETGSSNHSE
jgi:hypothetical protein